MRPKDVAGQRFGKLVALAPVTCYHPRSRAWACKCDCGAEVIILSGNLYSGRSKSCGCGKRRPAR